MKVLKVLFALAVIVMIIDFVRFPECYITTLKYHLETDIDRGNAEAIKYYNETYIANGRILFDE